VGFIGIIKSQAKMQEPKYGKSLHLMAFTLYKDPNLFTNEKIRALQFWESPRREVEMMGFMKIKGGTQLRKPYKQKKIVQFIHRTHLRKHTNKKNFVP